MVAGLKANANARTDANAEVEVGGYPAAKNRVNIFNIGTDDMTTVKRIAEIVCEEMRVSPKPKFKFTGGKRGWKGDVPIMLLDASKLNELGWKQRYNSEEAVRKAAVDLLEI
jgi:UDP-glucose 4-epimerase